MWHLISGKELLSGTFMALPELKGAKAWKLKILNNQLFLGIDIDSPEKVRTGLKPLAIGLEFEAWQLTSLRIFHWQAEDLVTVNIWKNCGLIWVSLRGALTHITFSCVKLQLLRVAPVKADSWAPATAQKPDSEYVA
jgi:hypothetical protein